jgi:RNA polymerase sigma factor (sigma-70 family)
VTSFAPVKGLDHAGLVALVAWAIRAALARAQLKGLPEDELVSEALHAIHGALRTHAGGTTISAHVRRRVRGALLDVTRREMRRRERELLLDDTEEAQGAAVKGEGEDEDTQARALGVEAQLLGSPEESLLRREARAALDREVSRLSRDDQRLYALRHQEGLTWEEIAAQTGMPSRTGRSHDKRIRARLTAALRAFEGEG